MVVRVRRDSALGDYRRLHAYLAILGNSTRIGKLAAAVAVDRKEVENKAEDHVPGETCCVHKTNSQSRHGGAASTWETL